MEVEPSVESIFADFQQRRRGIITALSTDQEAFCLACDPERENLCLFGNSDGSWEVELPAEEIPPELPEPALGINFARDGMQRQEWLSLVAVHSDCWVLSVAYYNAVRLDKKEREELFLKINELPTIYEFITGKYRDSGAGAVKLGGGGGAKKRGAPGVVPQLREPAPRPAPARPSMRPTVKKQRSEDLSEEEEEDDDAGDGDTGYGDGEGDPCPNCGRIYRAGDFWIACDFCDTWYDGKCVQMTPQKAQKQGKWRCPACCARG